MKFVLVPGASHKGEHFSKVAELLWAAGHEVMTPTLAGNRDGDDASKTTLDVTVDSLVKHLKGMTDVVLLGHSWGSMPITGAYDRATIKRPVYYSAFVPNPGECLIDMVPPHYAAMFKQTGEATGSTSCARPS